MAARKAASAASSLRAAVMDPWRNVKHEQFPVPEWGANVVVRGLTLGEWNEYNRMAQLLQPVTADDDAPAPAVEPWAAHGVRALYAFVVVVALHDAERKPVFATDPQQRANDIAEVAAGYSHTHDRIVAKVYELSGLPAGEPGEAAPDPVDAAGNA
jgi:hypothetical protein